MPGDEAAGEGAAANAAGENAALGQAAGRRRLTGRLSAESVERGGLYLLGSDLGRLELVLSRPLRRHRGRAGIADESGQLLAAAGDEVVVTGSVTDQIASTHQQGRMFLVATVERGGPRA